MSDQSKYGLDEGKLHPCPDSPNCVCSEFSDDSHSIEPIAFNNDADVAWSQLLNVVAAQPRTKIVDSGDGYLQARVTTRLLRFEDVLEFRLDRAAGAIQVRSASQVGFSDLGVNRRRVETIRKLFGNT